MPEIGRTASPATVERASLLLVSAQPASKLKQQGRGSITSPSGPCPIQIGVTVIALSGQAGMQAMHPVQSSSLEALAISPPWTRIFKRVKGFAMPDGFTRSNTLVGQTSTQSCLFSHLLGLTLTVKGMSCIGRARGSQSCGSWQLHSPDALTRQEDLALTSILSH